MSSKRNKHQHGKQNEPIQFTYQQSSKIQAKLNPHLTDMNKKVSNNDESQNTSTTISSNISLNAEYRPNVNKLNQDDSIEPWNQTSIKQIQEKNQDPSPQKGKGVKRQQSQEGNNKNKLKGQKGINQEEGHYIIPDSSVKGQFQKCSKQQKNSEAQKELIEIKENKDISKINNYEQLQWASNLIKSCQETVESERNWKQEKSLSGKKQQQGQAIQKHYIIPDSMYEGQFTYVTKQKKQEDIEEQLQKLEEEKRELEISTQHYVNPTTVVQGQLPKISKQLKKQQIQKEIKNVEEANVKPNTQEDKSIKPKVMPRINLHEFYSNEIPQLHQQDIPLQHQTEQLPINLQNQTAKSTMNPIKPLDPVPVKLKIDNQQQKLNPLYIQVPKSQKLPSQYEHYIIPGTMFEGQFTYVTKQKKEEDVEQQLNQLQNQKRQLQISTQHYINPATVVEGQIPNLHKQLKKQQIQEEIQRVENVKRYPFNKNKNFVPGSQPLLQQNDLQQKNRLQKMSNFQIEDIRLSKERCDEEGSLRFQISSKDETYFPVKLDSQSAMTVLTNKNQDKSTFILPQGEQANYDLQILVMDAQLNKESSSPKDVFQTKPTNILNMDKVPNILNNLKTQDGSPLKVIIGTKQFANFPNQLSPSPPIIDEITLKELRNKNQKQMQKTGERVSPPPKILASKNADDSFTISKRIELPERGIDKLFTSQDLQQEKIIFEDQQNLTRKKKKNKNQNQQPSLIIKFVRSLAISSLLGGFAWIGFKDRKITAMSAAAGLAIALISQR